MSYLIIVKNWMIKFLVPMRKTFGLIPKERYELRYRLMEEENNEYLEACKDGDLVEIADAIGDKLFILMGTAVEHGMSQNLLDRIFNEIKDSNYSKLDENKDPIFREDGKILKSSKFFKPRIKGILSEYMANQKKGV
jgi:predicted HAD superfamily Cof-like phosphohydrolase